MICSGDLSVRRLVRQKRYIIIFLETVLRIRIRFISDFWIRLSLIKTSQKTEENNILQKFDLIIFLP